MAVQQWTIMKLVGPAAGDAAARFDHWWRARRPATDDPECFTNEDWPPCESTILINRHVMDVSPTDNSLKAAAAIRPKWLGRPLK